MRLLFLALTVLLLTGCGHTKTSTNESDNTATGPVGPTFMADSAYQYCQQQCDFGPRIMNSEAHERCGQWIADKFRQAGMDVTLQQADLRGYDGTILKSTNILASYHPDASNVSCSAPIGTVALGPITTLMRPTTASR